MAVLGLRFCARAFSSCGKWGPLFITVRGPLTMAASPVVEHRLQKRRLSNCGSRAQLLRGMWDPPRPGPEPVCPALAGRFSTTAPPGKPCKTIFKLKGWVMRMIYIFVPNSFSSYRGIGAWFSVMIRKMVSIKGPGGPLQWQNFPLSRSLWLSTFLFWFLAWNFGPNLNSLTLKKKAT